MFVIVLIVSDVLPKLWGYIFLIFIPKNLHNSFFCITFVLSKEKEIITIKTFKTMENKGYVIYDNHNVDYNEWFDEFKNYCEDNDIDSSMYDENSEYFYEWVWNTLNMYWEDFIDNLKHDKDNNVECVVRGKVGTWRGNFEIDPKTFITLEKAIYACVRDCDYITITQTEDGAIDVYASHHDGSHSFTIHKLNDLSYEVDEDEIDLTDEKYYDKFNIQY